MDDQQLINLVRSQPILYDPDDRKYLDNNLKIEIWNEIGKELGACPTSCKKRWSNIRDNFRKSFQKNAIKSSQGKKVVPYRFYEELSFMIKYMGSKNSTENIRDSMTDSNDELSLEPNPAPLVTLQDISSPPLNTNLFYTQSHSTPVSDLEDTDPLTESGERSKKRRMSRCGRDDRNTSRSGSAEVLDYLIRQNEHPVDAFLASIAPVLKELHPWDWFEAKSEIFALVQKYEAKLLSEKFANQKNGFTNCK